MSNSNADQLVGNVLGGKYKVVARVGEGGMGTLYLAQHAELGRSVAVKVLVEKLSGDDKYLRRFQQEAKLAASLSHANVCHVYDYGQLDSGAPYLVMDFLEGNTLAALLAESKFLSIGEALPIFQQICKGLAHAHGRGLVHRDLKPSNIMLIDSDGEKIVKVLDFGIAKEVDSVQGLTQTGELFGSPLYMSPEQCSGQQIDARSDIYSVGCLMYEVLTGHVPLRGETIVQTIFKHMNESPLPMTEICPQCSVPESVEKVIRKAMAKAREDRHQTVGELGERLTRSASEQAPARDAASGAVGNAAAVDASTTKMDAGASAGVGTARGTASGTAAGTASGTAGETASSGGASCSPTPPPPPRSGIVVSPLAGLAILVAALMIGGAAVMISSNRGTQSSVSTSVITADPSVKTTEPDAADRQQTLIDEQQESADLRQEAADSRQEAVDEQAGAAPNTVSKKTGAAGSKYVKFGTNRIEVSDGDSHVVLDGIPGLSQALSQASSEAQSQSQAQSPNNRSGPVSVGVVPSLINRAKITDRRKWKRSDLSYPLITWTNPHGTGSPEVRVVYCHQAWDQGFSEDNDYLHIGHIDVNVKPNLLGHPVIPVLSGYAPIVWTVKPEPGVKISKVILIGLQQKVVGVPAGVPIEQSSERIPPGPDDPPDTYQDAKKPKVPFASLNLSQGENVPEQTYFKQLATRIRQLTGREIKTFQYCGRAKEFTI
jgi:serine/threonine-protein kinase